MNDKDSRNSSGKDKQALDAGRSVTPGRDAKRVAPGKATRTSRAMSRPAPVPAPAPPSAAGAGASVQRKSAWDWTNDPRMDMAHRGVSAARATDEAAHQAQGDAVADRAVPVPPRRRRRPRPDQDAAGSTTAGPRDGGGTGGPTPTPGPAPTPGPTPGPGPTPTPTGGGTPGATPAAPGATPGTAGPGTSIAASFNANRVAHPSAPAFGEVDWNANDPVATYDAYLDGSNWRFRLTSLSLDVPVGVASGGRTDVPSAAAAVVTDSTWEDVADDLEPGGGTPNRSPRSAYWAEDLTWVHEIFHFDEFNTFLRTSFGSFETTIEGSGYTEAQQAGDAPADAVSRKSGDLDTRLLAAWNQAKVNMSPAMEDRAYDDGAPLYQARADEVRARAAREGWT
ncbi:hypothetical protein [Haliangium sp.]|uniref:hypothetical protein n=1 Tax=Haliangium sp. TaxID=2663208 RepID=UPI003D13C56F